MFQDLAVDLDHFQEAAVKQVLVDCASAQQERQEKV